MTLTKICPTCHKELPILAVSCKFCGFKLSGRPQSEHVSTTAVDTIPPSTPHAGTPVVMNTAPAPVAPDMKKRTGKHTLLGVAAPPIVRPSAPPARAPLAVVHNVDRPSSEPDTADSADWIPPVDEASQLVELDVESTGRVDISGVLEDSGAIPADRLIRARGDALSRGKETANRWMERLKKLWNTVSPVVLAYLLRPLLSTATMDRLREQNRPPALISILDRLRWLHPVIALLAVLFLIALVSIFSGESTEQTAESLTRSTSVQASTDGVPSQSGISGKQKDAAASSGTPILAMPKSPATCLPFGAYPQYLWSDRVHEAIRTIEAPGICGLFGRSRLVISRLFADMPSVPVVAADGFVHGSSLVAYPAATATETGARPRIEFYFYDDKLFKFVLEYAGEAAEVPDFKEISEILGVQIEQSRRGSAVATRTFVDSDMRIRYSQSKKQGKLEFADRRALAVLSRPLAALAEGEAALAEGRRWLREKRYDDALLAYREAARVAPGYGAPFLGICEVHARLEEFDAMLNAAQEAVAASADLRVKARSGEYLAMAWLWQGNREDAAKEWEKSARLDPTEPYYRVAAAELKTEQYTLDRVARTAARMSCLAKLHATARGILIRGNFENTAVYFAALRIAKSAPEFSTLEKKYKKMECR